MCTHAHIAFTDMQYTGHTHILHTHTHTYHIHAHAHIHAYTYAHTCAYTQTHTITNNSQLNPSAMSYISGAIWPYVPGDHYDSRGD